MEQGRSPVWRDLFFSSQSVLGFGARHLQQQIFLQVP